MYMQIPHEEHELISFLLDFVLGNFSKLQTSSCIGREMKMGKVLSDTQLGLLQNHMLALDVRLTNSDFLIDYLE